MPPQPSPDIFLSRYIAHHVFIPRKLPQKNDCTTDRESALAQLTLAKATEFKAFLNANSERHVWDKVTAMLTTLDRSARFGSLVKEDVARELRSMRRIGDTRAFLVRMQNSGVIIRREEHHTIFESFEVSPTTAEVVGTEGKLLCEYPGPAVAVPNSFVHDEDFIEELGNFLSRMDEIAFDGAAPHTVKANSTTRETRDTTHPRYITELLTAILLGKGKATAVPRIQKRIGDEVLWKSAEIPWRRSSLWLVIRVALQTTLEHQTVTRAEGFSLYKAFMLFVHARFLENLVDGPPTTIDGFESELLFWMSAKMSRRAYKLEGYDNANVSPLFGVTEISSRVAKKVRAFLEQRHSDVLNPPPSLPPLNLTVEDFERDKNLRLTNSRSFIECALTLRGSHQIMHPIPSHSTRVHGFLTSIFDLDDILAQCVDDDEKKLHLIDFEQCVLHLDHSSFFSVQPYDADALIPALYDTIQTYHRAASIMYQSNHENMSAMFLTLLLLWVVADKSVISTFDALSRYCPDINPSIFDVLVLRTKIQHDRLHHAREYLNTRIRSASRRSILTHSVDSQCFPVLYFRSSHELQQLMAQIERDAEIKRDEKRQEFRQKSSEYTDLKDRAADMEHQLNNRGKHKQKQCPRCVTQRTVDTMSISVHEWPLPGDQYKAEAAVFELRPPLGFVAWRDATHFLVVDVYTPAGSNTASTAWYTRLAGAGSHYAPLTMYSDGKALDRRITLGSTTKSFLQAHYSQQKFRDSPSIDSLCVNNGLNLALVDTSRDSATDTLVSHQTLLKSCSPSIPTGPYSNLAFTVLGTTHTSNQIIAKQSTCDARLSLEDFYQFGTLRSGSRIQWWNILRQLRGRSLNYRHEEVHILYSQAIHQVGESDGTWHMALDNVTFRLTLLAELEALVNDIRDNWLELFTLRTAVDLLLRLLTADHPSSAGVAVAVFRLLKDIRETVLLWLNEALKSSDRTHDAHIQNRILVMAATMLSTFGAEQLHLSELLCSSRDVEVYIQCAACFYDYTPPKLDGLPVDSKRLIDRVRRILVHAEHHVWSVINSSREGLDKGIQAAWRAFHPNTLSPWTRRSEPDARWITCSSHGLTDQQSLCVHFNLHTGSLLVNGRSMGRLPTIITRHKSYLQIFGLEILDVLPANMQGMEYMTAGEIHGHQVFFRLEDDELFIAARRSNMTFYLIPRNILSDDLPASIIDGHTHWLNVASRQIIFRPDDRRWKTDSGEWILSYSRLACVLTRQDEASTAKYLVDRHSETAAAIYRYLSHIEASTFQIITYSAARPGTRHKPLLEVELPRSGFSFFFNSGRLYSREVEGFYVDEEQFTGTMLGLHNQLVLVRKPFVHLEERERSVLIPQGVPSASRQSETHRIQVHIPLPNSSLERVFYNVYRIDPALERLKFEGIPDMFTRFQELYLHALTSLVLPDPLTKQTGTELALHQLHGADCFSFSALKRTEIEILHRISALSPIREFYPVHLRSMETVSWGGSISIISQHERFRPLVDAILMHHERMQLLATNGSEGPSCSLPTRTHQQLYERALRRSLVYFREQDEQNVLPQTQPDKPYALRCHTVEDTSRFNSIVQQANVVSEFSDVVPVLPASDLYKLLESLSNSTISGVVHPTSLALHPDLLQSPKDVFLSLVNLCRHQPSRATLLFTTAALGYCTPLEWTTKILATLYAVARLFRSGILRSIAPPNHPCYSLSDGICLQPTRIKGIIASHAIAFHETPEADLPRHDDEPWATYDTRRRDRYRVSVESLEAQLTAVVTTAWNRGDAFQVANLPTRSGTYFNIRAFTQTTVELFESWRRNADLHMYTTKLTERLGSRLWLVITKPVTSLLIDASTASLAYRRRPLMTLSELIKTRSAPELILAAEASELQLHYNTMPITQTTTTTHLVSLARDVEALSSEEPFSSYSSRLYDSISALESSSSAMTILPERSVLLALRDYNGCGRVLESYSLGLIRTLAPNTPAEDAISASGLWPHLSRISLLCLLRHDSNITFKPGRIDHSDIPIGWKRQILSFVRAVIALQTARRRLLLAQVPKHHSQLAQDLFSTRKQLYNQAVTPDWLLMQIDSDIVIRDVQFHIAHLMLPTNTNDSICLQLNMGEGKSSVITPMVACAIADGTHLSRIIVLKTLTSQMSLTMRDRISGLVNRRLYYLPFSRTTKVDDDTIRQVETILTECIANGGVLIAQPEHILSFKLKTVGCQIPEGDAYPKQNSLTRIHAFMTKTSRDILDESDEILHVRYQLVYTSGDCQALEGHPHRWTMTQELLHLAAGHILKLQSQFPSSFASQGHAEINPLTSSFPALRLVEGADMVAEALVDRLADDIMDGRLAMFNPQHLTSSQKTSIRIFISNSFEDEELRKEIQLMRDEEVIDQRRWSVILLCRGLLAFGVLLQCLQDKRHRVDYGLDEKRSQLAVPYRAKDLPSTSAEFAHPDVVIILTCLSYYFRGLTENQLELCLQLIAGLDDPEAEYSTWISRAGLPSLPSSLMTLKGLNFDSPEQRDVICKHFQLNQRTIDFYLRSVVFPKDARQFASRLSCSSWDIIEPKANITTGFSGTNDFRDLLPVHITQKDPPHQLSTNARVLNHLLRDENNYYECFDFPNGQWFIKHIAYHKQCFRMILDVGAQMLDIGNRELISYWLTQVSSDFAIAGVYVNSQDQLIVLHRTGHEEQLVSSYISQQLERCIFYLDDAHTRGIDLQLPAGFRAAVTLGPKVTKDRLVQGCMRMRRLGAGHTVSFFAPADVDRKIRKVAQLHVDSRIAASHVLLWSIAETCSEINHRSLQWVYQGLDHARRRGALSRYWGDERPATLRVMKAAWVQPESRTVESMYGFNSNNTRDWVSDTKDHPELRRRCATLGLQPWASNHMTLLDEEQEREIAHEIEREEQVERPDPKEPAEHLLGTDVRRFVKEGEVTSPFLHAFNLFNKTPAKLPAPWINSLRMTRDFARTIKTSSKSEKEYFRPVHWVLSNAISNGQSSTGPPEGFVVLSPFEVNELAFEIMKSTKVRLHIFTPRTTLAMSPCEDLGFFTVPSMPTHIDKNFGFSTPPLIQLEIMLFSGQLYLRDYAQYLAVCEMLGLYANDLDGTDIVASVDGFIPPSRRAGHRSTAQFTLSPIVALTALINIRRKGLSFDQTHIGKILSGRRLFQDDFVSPSGAFEEVN